MNRDLEVQRLAQADHHIAVAERAITKQMLELEKLRRDRHDTVLAEKVLKNYENSLQVLKDHRATIARFIEQIDQGLA
jgi:hypothetical protein